MMSGRDEALNFGTPFTHRLPGSSSSVVQPLPSSSYHHSSSSPERPFPFSATFNLHSSPGSTPAFSSPVHNHYTNSPTPNQAGSNIPNTLSYPPYPTNLRTNNDFIQSSSMDPDEAPQDTPVKKTRRKRGEGASASISAASGSSVQPPRLAFEPGNTAPQGHATPVVNIKTKFPVARIKRIMQADEDVGKVAQVTPVIVSKALELFMISLCAKASEQARSRNSKRITAAHLKQAVLAEEQFDFLQEIMSKVPDIPLPTAETSNPGNSDDDDGSNGGGSGGGSGGAGGAGAAGPAPVKKTRKPRARRQTGETDGVAF